MACESIGVVIVTLAGGKIYAAYILGVENGVGALAPRIEFVELQTD